MTDLLARAPLDALRSRYAEPWRSYHVWRHVEAMLGHCETARADGVAVADSDAAVGFVLWHDAIYDRRSGGGRNERLSAELCRSEMSGLASERSVEHAVAAIEATATHRVPDAACPDAALLLDIDLSVLGADAAVFDDYDEAIAREYAHVPAADYAAGRHAILAAFLARDRLYLTDWAHRRWQAAARANLRRTIARLG